jgi:hypothetical protein
MIENLKEKLNGELPINRKELIELVNSHGRLDYFNILDSNIIVRKCEPYENYPLENLDVSQIDNLSSVFKYSMYNGDLSNWNVSNCTNMNSMFFNSKFDNNSLKDWNVSNVTKMNSIFAKSYFSSDISKWEFNTNVDCGYMFYSSHKWINTYNNCNKIDNISFEVLEWFEKNRNKIREINTPEEEILDFFSFNSNLEKGILE